jgi:ABC-type sugar transport system permease subunit
MRAHRLSLWLLTPLLLLLVPFVIWPALFGLLASFTNYAPLQPHLRFVGLRTYSSVLRDTLFQSAVRNIVILTVVGVGVELAFGFTIAYALRRPFRGRGLLRIALLVPWLISPVATGVMWHYLFNTQTGLVDFIYAWLHLPHLPSPLGAHSWALPTIIAIDIWRKTPLVSFLLLPGLLAIPSDQWDQATLDGAGLVARMRHIALPWLRPLMLTVAMLLIGDTLGAFDSILMLTGGGPGSATMTPGLYSYQQAFQAQDWTHGATAAWLIAAAVVVVGCGYLVLMRREVAE